LKHCGITKSTICKSKKDVLETYGDRIKNPCFPDLNSILLLQYYKVSTHTHTSHMCCLSMVEVMDVSDSIEWWHETYKNMTVKLLT
jgi:hypothetical protein